MKITIPQIEFARVLEVASHAIPSRPPNPILTTLLLIADSNTQQLTITAFDLSLGIRTVCNCNVETSGRIAIPAKLLVDVVSQLPKSDITLEVKDNVAVLTHATGKCQIQTMSPDDFPALPEVDSVPVTLSVTKLQQLLKATLFAASHDQTKQILVGVYFKFTASNHELAATDGHRLAVARATIESENSSTDTEPLEATIPYQSLTELQKLLDNVPRDGNCTVNIGKVIAIFELPNNVRVTTRLLEGQYPPYPSLIPQQFQYQFTINKQTLDSALKRVAIVADDKNNTAKFVFDIKGQHATISAESSALGGAVESVAIESESECQDNLKIGFNLKYLINALKYIPSTEVKIKANRPSTPVIVTPAGSSFNQLVLVMPLALTAGDLETQKTAETETAETETAETETAETETAETETETAEAEDNSTAVSQAPEAAPEITEPVPEDTEALEGSVAAIPAAIEETNETVSAAEQTPETTATEIVEPATESTQESTETPEQKTTKPKSSKKKLQPA